ncbi:MAG: NAD-dependent epimerase/dehydratase family protein, partial [Myxococcota bacterium]
MHALITGASGFVGGHLIPRLRDGGWRVTPYD